MNTILDAFEKRVFIPKSSPFAEARSESDNTDDEDGSNFETPKEVTPRRLIPDFNIDRLCEKRDEDE